QRPCYLLGEGYAKSFKELMDDTAWDNYGVGNYEKCADCMVHSGFEGTAVKHAMKNPLKALMVSMNGVNVAGEMRPEMSLDKQRKAEYCVAPPVDDAMAKIKEEKELAKSGKRSTAAEWRLVAAPRGAACP